MNSTTPLTARQRATLTFIADTIDRLQRPPTRREMSAHLGATSAAYHLRSIERRGLLRVTPGHARGITLTDDAYRVLDRQRPPRPSSPAAVHFGAAPTGTAMPGAGIRRPGSIFFPVVYLPACDPDDLVAVLRSFRC